MQNFYLNNKKERIKANNKLVIFSAFLFVFIFLISFSSAAIQVGLDGSLNEIGVNFDRTPFNISEQIVNASQFWLTTNQGPLSSTAQIDHNLLNNLAWSVAGHTFDEDVDFGGFDIFNINNINATDLESTNMPTVGGTSIQDTFVDVTGDTMTGGLVINKINGKALTITTTNTFFQTGDAIDITHTQASIPGTHTSLKVSGDPKKFFDLTTTDTSTNTLISATANSKSSGRFLAMSTSFSGYADNMLELTMSGSPTSANFLKFIDGTGDKFTIDSVGNMVVGGAYISPRGAIGSFENNAKYSEDLSNAVWIKTSASVDPNTIDAPDGTPNIADEISFSSSSGRVNQNISSKTAAGNTFTYYFWGIRTENVSGKTLRVRLTDSTRSEFSDTINIGLIGFENQWQFKSVTYTFSGSATGSPQIEIYTADSDTTGSIWGSNFVDGSSVFGYVPTNGNTEPIKRGGVINGHLHISSGSGSATIDMKEGLNQTDDYFSITNGSEIKKIFIDKFFNFNFLDNIKLIFGNNQNMNISYNGTDGLIDLTSGKLIIGAKIQTADIIKDRHLSLTTALSPSIDPMADGLIGLTPVALADDNQDESRNLAFHVPKDWKEGTNITFHVHILNQDVQTGVKSVVTQLEYLPLANEEDGSASGIIINSTLTLTTDSPAGTFYHAGATFILDQVNLEAGDMISMKISRLGTDASDTMVGDAGYDGVHIEFISNVLGE